MDFEWYPAFLECLLQRQGNTFLVIDIIPAVVLYSSIFLIERNIVLQHHGEEKARVVSPSQIPRTFFFNQPILTKQLLQAKDYSKHQQNGGLGELIICYMEGFLPLSTPFSVHTLAAAQNQSSASKRSPAHLGLEWEPDEAHTRPLKSQRM